MSEKCHVLGVKKGGSKFSYTEQTKTAVFRVFSCFSHDLSQFSHFDDKVFMGFEEFRSLVTFVLLI